jgi:hypothetical protein
VFSEDNERTMIQEERISTLSDHIFKKDLEEKNFSIYLIGV